MTHPAPGATTTVETPDGPVVAHRNARVMRAHGVPYATAERFQPPVAPEPWTAPHEGTPGPLSPQLPDALLTAVDPGYAERQGLDEHCQFLSVTWPADAPDDGRTGQGLPVVVWIHGGSYATGGGELPAYDPALLVEEQRVIVVSITYRLGVLGFLGDGATAPANLGLLDIIAALAWVQRSISAFGGDPDRVTAMGQSAGADAIASLLATEHAGTLFQRAILQSTPLGIARGREPMTAAMLRAAGPVAPDAPVAEVLDAQASASKAARTHGLTSLMPFGPQWGHAPLPPEAERDALTANAAGVDVMIGHLADEGALVGMRYPGLRRAFALPGIGRALHRVTAGALARAVYERPAAQFARAHREAGGRAIQYSLRWRAEGSPMMDGHGMDLPLLLGDPESWAAASILGDESAERILEVGRAVRGVWGDFIRTGDVAAVSAARAPVLTIQD
ncbi:carboxylesterase family protein [Demequina aestuarii]|uniref:carboxylesterase family protein n=1 Tax=Demequina aestuarii TaxID=327095 RepID=UPI0007840755|nr:carboxylesterase family protein [Demequina aestuarii]